MTRVSCFAILGFATKNFRWSCANIWKQVHAGCGSLIDQNFFLKTPTKIFSFKISKNACLREVYICIFVYMYMCIYAYMYICLYVYFIQRQINFFSQFGNVCMSLTFCASKKRTNSYGYSCRFRKIIKCLKKQQFYSVFSSRIKKFLMQLCLISKQRF